MAAGPPPAGFFSFLKHGVLVPARGRGIFLPLLALTAALAGALLLANSLAVQPRAVDVLLDADALSRADPASAAYPKLVRRFRHDLRSLLVFSVAAVTAYYFECRESKQAEEDMAGGHHYTKLPNGDEANI
uniref:Uncharacterized protein n=1 Tax=Oryza brachyantha TaxID=4533 RepID=J3MRM1_ORYBR